MKSESKLLIFALMLLILALSIALLDPDILSGTAFAQRPPPGGPQAPSALAGTAFTYQGQLKNNGALVNGSCDFVFNLWDAASSGNQIGTNITQTIPVTNGLFTTPIDFGNVFTGTARYLQSAVRCPAGSGVYTTLSPRQALTPAPYAFALPGLFTQQNATSPNIIGGYSGNIITPTLYGATISGGGSSGFENRVWANYATLGGGYGNTVSGYAATVGGGWGNTASGFAATIGGGQQIAASNNNATVGGGFLNTASGLAATVSGGVNNSASNNNTTVGGGDNNAASGIRATIGGGRSNTASGNGAFVGGGGYDGTTFSGNTASGNASTIPGGLSNSASFTYTTVGGGAFNTASGIAATVPGGANNIASGDYSFAAGQYANTNGKDGSFVWGDDSIVTFISATVPNQFLLRASGGITMYTNYSLTMGVQVPPGSGTWGSVSDRHLKDNFVVVNGRDVLVRLAAVPIQTWNYKTQDASIRHIGPMAQDFYAAFSVGEDDKHITTVDADGVALVAIQGLYQVVQEKEAEIEMLKAQSEKQQVKIESLEARVAALERGGNPSGLGGWNAAMALVIGALGVVAYERARKGGAG